MDVLSYADGVQEPHGQYSSDQDTRLALELLWDQVSRDGLAEAKHTADEREFRSVSFLNP